MLFFPQNNMSFILFQQAQEIYFLFPGHEVNQGKGKANKNN